MSQQTLPEAHADAPEPSDRRSGELTARELFRWAWRQLTSMRTALVLLLLLALAAIPGSVVPQSGVDSLKTSRWQSDHPDLTPIYERLGLFSVYDTAWFGAIYILLMISLVGCIIPRLFVYWRALRAQPPAAPRHLSRLPVHTYYATDETPEVVLERAQAVLRDRGRPSGHLVVTGARAPSSTNGRTTRAGWPRERGYLREAGNLLFHLAVVVVLVGFAVGGLFGYQGGVILVVGNGFSNNLTQYDDFDPGSLFDPVGMEPFHFRVEEFDVDWTDEAMARGFNAHVTYRESPDDADQTYDLRVNHPLKIGDTEVFLIGHGYAPVITVRDGEGNLAWGGPTVFLPEDTSLRVLRRGEGGRRRARRDRAQGPVLPTYVSIDGDPVNVMGELKNPTLSMLAYTGDLGMDDGTGQSVYELEQVEAHRAEGCRRVDVPRRPPARPVDRPARGRRVGDLRGRRAVDQAPDQPHSRHARHPGRRLAGPRRAAAVAVHPRRGACAVRARRAGQGEGRHDGVDVGGLDRSTAGDVETEVSEVVAGLRQLGGPTKNLHNPGSPPRRR